MKAVYVSLLATMNSIQNKTEIRKILLIKTRAMGDTVISTAAINSVRTELDRAGIARAEIHFLAPAPWHVLLGEHPAVDKLWVFRKNERLLARLQLIMKLRNEKFDAVIALHASGSTAWLAKLCGARIRSVHFHGIHDANRFSTVEIAGKGEIKPIIERDLDAVKAVLPEAVQAKTSLVLPQSAISEAREVLGQAGLSGPVLVLGPGASRPAKIWPVERFRKLAEDWVTKKQGSVVVLAGPGESALTEPLQGLSQVLVRLGGDLLINAALLSQAELYIGNDSGPKHLAVALGVKTLTLFGPESPLEWHPYDWAEHPVLYRTGLSCRKALAPGLPEWCSIHVCEKEGHRCMLDISPEQVEAHW